MVTLAALFSPLLAVVACASHPQSPATTIAAPLSDMRGQPVPRLIVPGGRGASLYAASASAAGETVAAPAPDSLRDAILADARALARRGGVALPDGDARLDLAMTDLARGLRGDDLPALEVVDFLLAHYGIVEPQPNLLLGRGTAAADAIIRKQTAAQVAEVLKVASVAHIGVGIDRSGGEMHVVVALQEQNVEVEPVPRRIAPGATAVVSGKINHGFADPSVVVTGPSGVVKRVEADARGAAFRSEVRCDAGPGRYQIEVTGVNESGPVVLANFPVYCGVPPPAEAPRDAGVQQNAVSPGDAERRLLDLVNRDRVAAGLPQVTLDGKLSEIARAHSRDMATHDYVAHVSPSTGTTLDRARRAGLQPPLILLENVGRASSPDQAETSFMSSPGHRGNILDRRATRIGIGVAVGNPVTGTNPIFVTQILM